MSECGLLNRYTVFRILPLTMCIGYVVGVSDFLMMSLAKLTVAVGKQVKDAVADTEV